MHTYIHTHAYILYIHNAGRRTQRLQHTCIHTYIHTYILTHTFYTYTTQVDAHRGFDIITDKIQTTDKRVLLVLTSLLAFFLSAVLDNLTTTIVMVSLLSKLVTVCKCLLYKLFLENSINVGGMVSLLSKLVTVCTCLLYI
jgi:Na+/H+ antiporter NhaD/arsenite permease-like protein